MTDTTEFFTTRPRLATLLIEKGFPAEIRPNPWNSARKAWVFQLSRDLAVTVFEYYTELEQRVPAIIEKYLAEQLHNSPAGKEFTELVERTRIS